ncbi:MAG: TonB-dependent receptor [Pseudomonadota bacterium]
MLNITRASLLATVSALVFQVGGAACAQDVQAADQEQDVGQLDVIVVEGRSFRDPSDSTATKLNIPLSETAGQVLVLNEELYDSLGNIGIADAISFIPGVTNSSSNPNGGGFFIARGFGVNRRNAVRINGAPLGEDILFDQVALGRLEYVKGSQSAAYGQISAGGFINVSLKESPSDAPAGNVRLQGDSWDGLRGEVSYGGPLNASGTLRGFAALSKEESPLYYDGNQTDFSSQAAYGTLGYDVTDALSVDYYLYYSDREVPNGGGIALGADLTDPANPLIAPVNVDRNFFGSGAFASTESELLFNQIVATYDLADGHSLRASYSKVDIDDDLFDSGLFGGFAFGGNFIDVTPGSPTAGLAFAIPGFNVAQFNREVDTTFAELRYGGEFDITENARLNVIVSGEVFRYDADFTQFAIDASALPAAPFPGPPPIIDVFSNPFFSGGNPFLSDPAALGGFSQSEDIDSVSLLASLDLYDRVRLNGAVRHDDREASSFGTNFENSTESYSGSIAVDITEDITAYYAYSEGFEFTTALQCDGSTAPPEENRSHEAGVKWEPNSGLLMSVAYFDNQAVNGLQQIQCPMGSSFPQGSVLIDNEQSADGVEFEIVGQLTPNWNIAGGISYIDDSFGPTLTLPTPETSLNFFTVYDITDGPLAGLSIGGGVRAGWNLDILPESLFNNFANAPLDFAAEGVTSINGVPLADAVNADGQVLFADIIDSDLFEFFVVDALVSYDFTDNLQFQLNARNLFNEKYITYPQINNGNSFGAPRQIIGTISFDF